VRAIRLFQLSLGMVLVGAAPGLEAQLRLSPELGWSRNRDLGLGGRASWEVREIRVVGEFVHFFPSGDGVASPDVVVDPTYWEANVNALFPFDRRAVTVYLGAGAGYAKRLLALERDGFRSEADVSDWALNLILGARLPGDGPSPFAESKVEIGRNRQFMLLAGVAFPITVF